MLAGQHGNSQRRPTDELDIRCVEESKTQKESLSKNIQDKQAELKKEQKNLLAKEEREELGSMFLGLLTEFLAKLNAKGVNLNKVKHPSDYNKIFGSGGAAECTRAALAYQMAVFRQIYSVRWLLIHQTSKSKQINTMAELSIC